MRESVVEIFSKDVEAAEDVAVELNNKKKIVRENVMKILLEYKVGKYIQMVQEALQEKKNASFIEKFAPLLGVGGDSENIEELCSRIVTEQKRNSFVQWIGNEPQIRLRNSNEIADVKLPLAYVNQYV